MVFLFLAAMFFSADSGAAEQNKAAVPVKLPAPLRYAKLATGPNQPLPPLPLPKRREEVRRPRMEGSATGYIDNAIVGSQIRIRFDAGFDFTNPDRAEFFYGKCGCYRGLQTALPQYYDPNAPGPPGGIVTKANFQELQVTFEYAPTDRVSVFVETPVRWIQPTTTALAPVGKGAGVGDVRVGIKLALIASRKRYLTFQMRGYVPSGDSASGLGTSHATIEPELLFNERLSERATLAGQFGDWHPIGGSAGAYPANNGFTGTPGYFPPSQKFSGDILTYGLGASYDLYSGPQVRFTPVVEAIGWSILDGFATFPTGTPATETGGVNIVNLKLGARTSWGGHNSIYIGYGRELSHVHWYRDILRVEYRYLH